MILKRFESILETGIMEIKFLMSLILANMKNVFLLVVVIN